MNTEHRYELKYLAKLAEKKLFLKAVLPNLVPDPFGDKGLYRVSSQYFDSPDLDAFWEKLDGVAQRRKFRLRYYGENVDEAPSFFEIKNRQDQTVFKERIALQTGHLPELLSSPTVFERLSDFAQLKTPADRGLCHRISRVGLYRRMTGQNIISYKREAWVGAFDHRVRVTFDHDCTVFPPGDPFAVLKPERGLSLLPKDTVVMEVKFNRSLPIWLRDCLTRRRLRVIRYSKYAEGVMARDESLPRPTPRSQKSLP